MITPYERMAQLAAEGRRYAVATVVRTHGSTPQTVGARLIVTDDAAERPFGTLGGGCVEADAILAARDALNDGHRSLRQYELTEDLDWNTGLVCGGTMWILAEPGEAAGTVDGRNMVGALAAAAGGGAPLAVVTLLEREGRGWRFVRRAMVREGGQLVGSLGTPALDTQAVDAAVTQMSQGPTRRLTPDDDHELLIEPVAGRPHLVIAGGGHVSRAMARQARLLDFDVTVLEDRPAFAEPERFDGAAVIEGDVTRGIADITYGPQTYLVVATRGHKMDADCVLAAARTDARYVGLLGSRRKTVLIAEMLREAGIGEDRIRVIHAPVGLDLGGRTPAEIALAVLAEITQIRHQGTGRPLRDVGPSGRAEYAATSD